MTERGSGELFRAIAEFTYDWESWIGLDGQLRWVNAAVERITGYSVGRCRAMANYPLPIVHEPDRPAIAHVLARGARGESDNHHEFRIARADGRITWGAISWQPIFDASGEPLGYRTSVREVDAHKRMEAALRTAVKRAEAEGHAKTQFLANVSHELRTPLQSILGYAQLLAGAELRAPLGHYVRVLLEQGQQLEHLVGDLLDFTSLQAGALTLRAVRYDPESLIERTLSALVPLAEQKNLALRWSARAPETLVGDPPRIAQVLTNLVGNAIKFTPSGEVRVEARMDASNALIVTIDDTGPGLPEGQRLFVPFRQGRADAETFRGGVGLGLAISRELCDRMGGTLSAGRSLLGGARFTAVFPGSQVESATRVERFEGSGFASLPSRSFARSRPLSILVVDDVRAAREFLRDALQALGYAPAVADSADEAFRVAERLSPDLVLVDLHMPEVDGWAAARGLRARVREHTFLVALSADVLAEDAPRLSEAGFDGFAKKPLDMRELQALLVRTHEHCSRHKSDSQREEIVDRARWEELRSIEVGPGQTLLDRMRQRVAEDLPQALERAERSSRAGELEAFACALHDVHGLLALIGASRARAVAERCETELDGGRGRLDESLWRGLLEAAREVQARL